MRPRTRRTVAVVIAVMFAPVAIGLLLWFAFPYAAYRIYMAWLASGMRGGYVTLSAPLAAALAPHYRHDLAQARFALTVKLPSNLAVADCKTVYFGNEAIVRSLREGTALTDGQLRWLSHELTHGEQCERWGGRKAFAKTWFGQADAAAWRTVMDGGLASGVREYVRTQYIRGLHDSMPMEEEADARARAVTGFDR